MSPDLESIEHVWDRIDRKIRNQVQQPRKPLQLEQGQVNAWNGVHQIDIRRLCLSMRRRYTAVINAAGGHTFN